MKVLTFLFAAICFQTVAIEKVQIAIPPAEWKFSLGQITELVSDQKLTPEEQPLALQLKPLLEKEQYSQALKLLNTEMPSNPSVALLMVKAQLAMRQEQYSTAEQTFLAIIKKQPGMLKAQRSLALIYLHKNNPKAARLHLIKAIELGAQDDQLFGQLAYLHLQNKEPWSAVAGYRQALLLAPNNEQWRTGLMYALLQSGANSEANALLQEMLNKKPKEPDLWLQYAQLALQQQQPKQALARMEVALRNGSRQTANLVLAAQLHLKHGSAQRSIDLFARALKGGNKYINEVLQGVGYLLRNQSVVNLAPLMSAVERNRKNLDYRSRSKFYTYRAQAALQRGKTKQAEQDLLRALKIDANNGSALLDAAKHFRNKKQFQRASLYYTRAAALPAVAEQALLLHAQLSIEQQQYPKALELLRTAYKNNPTRQDLLGNIRQLEQLTLNKS